MDKLTIDYYRTNPFSLVLSGGSAYGFAHMGIIKYLDEQEVVPKEIIGTSMGAIIGSLYALGWHYDRIHTLISKLNIFQLVRFQNRPGALFSHRKIRDLLFERFGEMRIADLPRGLKIVSTDETTGKMTIFDSNSPEPLVDIICTTFSIPSVFSSWEIDEVPYLDGFLSSNLPLEATSFNRVLGIDVINRSQLETFTKKNAMDILKRSFVISIINQSRLQKALVSYKETTLIEPNLAGFDFFDFLKWEDLSDRGYAAIASYFETL